jgi:hypothetical protein
MRYFGILFALSSVSLSDAASTKEVGPIGQLIYVGTTPGHISDGVITANPSGVFHNAPTMPYGNTFRRPTSGNVANFVEVFVNTEQNDYNGVMYGKPIPPSSGKSVGFIAKRLPGGKPVYRANGCPNTAYNGLLWTRNHGFSTCGVNELIGYLRP